MYQQPRKLAVVLIVLFTGSARAVTFSDMTVFGDSLSDVGNIDSATLGLQPGSGYFDGRFSNGELYVEYLARGLGLAVPTPSTDGGRNYAYGGAWAADQPDVLVDLLVEDLDEQVPNYLAERTPTADELFIVFAGGNDLVADPGNVNAAIASIRDELDRLADAGARHFFVPNLLPLGMVPRFRGTAGEQPRNDAVALFNQELADVLDDLEADVADASIYRLDLAMLFAQVFADPAAFGFTNVTDPAMGQAGIDADAYLFWDDLHPTTAGHALLADLALAAIPEPGVTVLFVVGFTAMGRRGWRGRPSRNIV